MAALAMVMGVQLTGDVAVEVDSLDCPTGNPIVDLRQIRDSLKKLLDDSKPNAAHDTLKKELAGYVLQHRVTGEFSFYRSPIDPTATNCNVEVDASWDSSIYELVAVR